MDFNLPTIILLIVAFAAALSLWLLGGRECMGELLNGFLPCEPISVGDKVNIFLNGKYNRTATITGVKQDKVFIYGKIGLPVDYRGRFYALGIDANDGSKVVFIKYNKHYKWVRVAELIRKAFNVLDDMDNMPIDDTTIENEQSDKGEEAQDEV